MLSQSPVIGKTQRAVVFLQAEESSRCCCMFDGEFEGNENALVEEKSILPWIVGFKSFNRYLFGLQVITKVA